MESETPEEKGHTVLVP